MIALKEGLPEHAIKNPYPSANFIKYYESNMKTMASSVLTKKFSSIGAASRRLQVGLINFN